METRKWWEDNMPISSVVVSPEQRELLAGDRIANYDFDTGNPKQLQRDINLVGRKSLVVDGQIGPQTHLARDRITGERKVMENTTLDHFGKVESTTRHVDHLGIDTHGYGLTEAKRVELNIPLGDDKEMARKAMPHFEQTARSEYAGYDRLKSGEKAYVLSQTWNTGTLFGSSSDLLDSSTYSSTLLHDNLTNIRADGANVAGLGNRRAKDYNVLARARGWPTVTRTDIAKDRKTMDFVMSDGSTVTIDKTNSSAGDIVASEDSYTID